MDETQVIANDSAIRTRIDDRVYSDRRLEVFAGGFVQQHVLHATGINGAVLAMRVCIVIRLAANGRISRIDEYFDPREIEPLL